MKFIVLLFLVRVVTGGEDEESGTLDQDIVNGSIIGDVSDFPFLVSLHYTRVETTSIWDRVKNVLVDQTVPTLTDNGHCTGSLVAANWVLTAAHCAEGWRNGVSGNWRWIARVGTKKHKPKDLSKRLHDFISYISFTSMWKAEYVGVGTLVSKIVKHENFIGNNRNVNDIALMKLAKPVPLGHPSIGLIKLMDDFEQRVPLGRKCIALGFGCTGYQSHQVNEPSEYARKVVMPILGNYNCTENFLDATITHKNICAGYIGGNKGTCPGDSGGPLICNGSSPHDWRQVGIDSFGGPDERYPEVFTRVSSFYRWIKETMATN